MMTTIEKLFDIVYGQREYHNKEWLEGTEGENILISSKGEDNGVYGFYEITNKFKAPFITVQGYGTIGQAFVQERDCSVDDHLLVLIPKVKLSLEQLYQIAYQIRLTKWKYRYGRGITPDRLNKQEVILFNSHKDWITFEREITPSQKGKVELTKPTKVKIFKLKDLFEVEKGKGSYLEKLDEGDTPIISTQNSNCGVCGFYDIEPIFPNGSITIGRIMCNPSIQIKSFSTVSDDMFVLTSNQKNVEFLIYVSAIIKKEGWRFNYSRKVTKEKLGELDIPLPIKEEQIDYEYIKKMVKSHYGYEELREYL